MPLPGGRLLRHRDRRSKARPAAICRRRSDNLSKVLRDRKKMKAKVTRCPWEAKASASSFGACPFIVAFLVYPCRAPATSCLSFTHRAPATSSSSSRRSGIVDGHLRDEEE